jgi:hypothetical protein
VRVGPLPKNGFREQTVTMSQVKLDSDLRQKLLSECTGQRFEEASKLRWQPLSEEAEIALKDWLASGQYAKDVAELVADDSDLRS